MGSAYSASISAQNRSVGCRWIGDTEQHTFLHILGLRDAFLDLFSVLNVGLAFERLSKAISEIVEAEWILSAKVQKFYGIVMSGYATIRF
jgi:hypothetical protein